MSPTFTYEIAVTATFVSIISMIMGLICIYWQYAFYLLRNVDHIEARHPKSSLLCGILCVIGLIFIWPYTIMVANVQSWNNFLQHHMALGIIPIFMILVCSIGVYHVFTWRAWIVYFDVKWHNALEDNKWRLFIDPDENNWFLKHRNTWGSRKRIGLILFVHLSIFAFMLLIVMIGSDFFGSGAPILVLGSSGILPTICDIVMYIQYPKFNDVWELTKEIKWTLGTELCAVIGLPLFLIIANTEPPCYTSIFQSLLAVMILFFYSYVMHYRPLKRHNLPTSPFKAFLYVKTSHIIDLTDQCSSATLPSANEEQVSTMQLRDVLKDENGFNLFARHLSLELSIENFLFIVELQQWVKQMSSKHNFEDENAIQFPSNAPQSKVMEMDDMHKQVAQIFSKFIANDAYFVINISYGARNRLYRQCGYADNDRKTVEEICVYLREQQMDAKTLFNMFDASRKEIWRLLYYAFGRFKRSDLFMEFEQNLVEQV